MRRFVTHLAAAALFGPFLSSGVLASDGISYPRVVGTGENQSVEYGPGERGNIVGGGRVAVSGSGENTELRHLDDEFAQAPHLTMVPVFFGSGESLEVVWMPGAASYTSNAAAEARRSARR
jgi:hypothetical protein